MPPHQGGEADHAYPRRNPLHERRWEDFQVWEIAPDGTVATITSTAIPEHRPLPPAARKRQKKGTEGDSEGMGSTAGNLPGEKPTPPSSHAPSASLSARHGPGAQQGEQTAQSPEPEQAPQIAEDKAHAVLTGEVMAGLAELVARGAHNNVRNGCLPFSFCVVGLFGDCAGLGARWRIVAYGCGDSGLSTSLPAPAAVSISAGLVRAVVGVCRDLDPAPVQV